MPFLGFSEHTTDQIRIPDQFFRQVLFEIEDINELRLTLYIFWYLDRIEGPFHYIRFTDLTKDSQFTQSMGSDAKAVRIAVGEALQKAVSRGTLLQAEVPNKSKHENIICLNSPKGRALIEAIRQGTWRMPESTQQPTDTYTERPNIFQLYEANIGPLTPMIADALRDAENTYQANWIEDAFRIAVESNKRNWHYIEAILRRWQEGGRDDRKDQQNRRDTEEARRRYGEWEN
jgi:DNA replication protein